MAPLIRDGDVLTVTPIEEREPRAGDVVAFVRPQDGRLAIHRVVARVGTGWLVRGDNTPRTDGVVRADDILGVVTRVEREGRDVRLGLGREAVVIAKLSRIGLWLPFMRSVYTARRLAGVALRRAQGMPAWRAAGRRLGLAYTITVASSDEVRAVQRRLDPDAQTGAPAPSPDAVDWIAKLRGRVIGFVQYVYGDAEAGPWAGHWLFSLTVWQPYRALGVGEALSRQVVAHAVSRGADELRLAVFEDNKRAIALYRKLGFEPTVVPALEPLLAEEARQTGRRRIVMVKGLAAPTDGGSAGAPARREGGRRVPGSDARGAGSAQVQQVADRDSGRVARGDQGAPR